MFTILVLVYKAVHEVKFAKKLFHYCLIYPTKNTIQINYYPNFSCPDQNCVMYLLSH